MKKIVLLAFIGSVLLLSFDAQAKLAVNKLAVNKLAVNKLAVNKLAVNKLVVNKLAVNGVEHVIDLRPLALEPLVKAN